MSTLIKIVSISAILDHEPFMCCGHIFLIILLRQKITPLRGNFIFSWMQSPCISGPNCKNNIKNTQYDYDCESKRSYL